MEEQVKNKLLQNMTDNLPTLRAKLGISQEKNGADARSEPQYGHKYRESQTPDVVEFVLVVDDDFHE